MAGCGAVVDVAKMSTVSRRHFFATQSELVLFAMTLVTVRVEERIAGIDFDPDIRRAIRQFTDQFVPLDEDRREEMQVWEAFAAAAQTDSTLTAVRDETDRTLFEHYRTFVDAVHDAGFLQPRSAERREGKECVHPCSSRWYQYQYKQQ